ncbi:MAG: replication-associated recombination protein A [Ruminococcus sp.]|nr:replication-associated recombination protein A [Ruminococcus sp.]
MNTPLADRLRPQSLDDIVGQKELLAPGRPLRKIIESGKIPNLIFYGPSGVGKTTLASYIARITNRSFKKLNGTTASTADIKDIVSSLNTFEGMNGVLLYLDEIQYLNKKQQQTLLEFIENGSITLIASTTENPYFYIYNAILSRSTVFEFKPVEPEEIMKAIDRAIRVLSEEQGREINFSQEAKAHICSACGGDVRKSLNAVELCVLAGSGEETVTVDEELAKSLTQRSGARYDRDGDAHYDVISAYQKSMRGSDVDAALFYLARLVEADDLISACRRLVVCACEDVGLAYPQIIPIVKSCVDIAMQVGFPEARIPLADAVIMVCLAPKSNSGESAISAAQADVRAGLGQVVPRQLQNVHYDGEERAVKGQHYLYPHSYPNHWIDQQYLPDDIRDHRYYTPGENKTEQAYQEYWKRIKGE